MNEICQADDDSNVYPRGIGTRLTLLRERIRTFMSIPVGNPELLKAQYRAFSRQLPMMYFILMTSTWAVAATHMAYAPYWLTMVMPAAMTVFSAYRVVHWWRSRRVEPTAEIAALALH